MADPATLLIATAIVGGGMGLAALQEFDGMRLDDLRVTLADYNTPLNYAFALARFDGVSCFWAEPLREVKRRRKTKGGKFNEWTYFGTWAVAVCDNEIAAFRRIWFDRKLVYDASGAGPLTPFDLADAGGGLVGAVTGELGLGDITRYMSFYLGTADQEPDPRMAATVDAEHGEGSTPAYRGLAYIVFKDLPLEKLGNRLPQVTVEVVTAGVDNFPMRERGAAYAASTIINFSPDFSRAYWITLDSVDTSLRHLEIWDVAGTALMNHVELESVQPTNPVAVDAAGLIYLVEDDQGGFVILNPDGIGQVAQHSLSAIGAPIYVADGSGVERIIFTSWSLNVDGGSYVVGAAAPEVIDTSALTGSSWQVKFAFADTYGDVWLLGGAGDLTSSQLAIYRYVNTSGRAGPDFAILAMPISNGGAITNVCGYHRADDTYDMIVVRFGNGNGCIVQIAIADLTVIDSEVALAGLDGTICAALVPGDATVWVGGDQWDFSTFSIVRTVHASSWDPTFASNQTMLYDRLSHALIRTSGAQDFQWLYLDRISSAGVTLESIVDDVSARCGLVAGTDYDASDLTQIVAGYSARQGPARQWLEPLLEAHDSEVRPHDFLLEFVRRGVAVGGAIPVSDMGAGGTVRYSAPALGETELALKVSLSFSDIDKDLQPNAAVAQRSGAATDSRREASIDGSTLVLDADTARQMAEGYLRRQWIKSQTYELSLSRLYTALEPGDARQLELDGVTVEAKLVRNEFGANGVLTQTWERYAPSVHAATALPGAGADGLTPSEVLVFGYTKGIALDIPLSEDSHDAAAPFVYLAAAPYSDTSWPGAVFYRGDDGVAYDQELGSVAAAERASVGYALSALPDAAPHVWDRGNAVTVQMFSGELASATEAECENGANLAVIGSELVNFKTAILIAPGKYQLTGFLRGRRGSEWASADHAAGDAFVLLDGLPRADMGADDVGDTVYVRPTTAGGPAGFPQTLGPYAGAALKPYAPAHLEVDDVAGDLVATWIRRSRIGGNWSDLQDVPLGEGSEAYLGQVLDAGGAVIRTFSGLSSPTLTYTAAQQATDGGAGVTLRVMQVSATIGNGYAADIAI